ncbi:MAG: hypothetical protein CVU73_14630 [Deltaproteobacteria bacterium HGW-Deltaproteobacteria-8]|nr:MAG: hypothetical protein CVU73_14630 [Deltaproteobacteria bacterium HGW-Deltaproteobacteria-8]
MEDCRPSSPPSRLEARLRITPSIQRGTSLYVVQKLLRHSDGRMTARYSHLADETLRRASDTAGSIMQKAQDRGEHSQVVNLENSREG